MTESSTQDIPAQKLSDCGLRSTPHREVVYNLLLKSRFHPTADEVYAKVKTDMPTISLATVYNCLDRLVQCNLVRQFNFDNGPSRYCPNLEPHAHFHDERTGSIQDVELPPDLLEKVKAVLPAGYVAKSIEITFRGEAKS
jgi:Fur family transcriptional regulator, peroxide stress response regulator